MQRIQAVLFHHGVAGTPDKLRTSAGRAFLDALTIARKLARRSFHVLRELGAVALEPVSTT
jgi:hypothetical protein